MKPQDYDAALAYIDRVDPDLLVLAWPCGPWSPLQSLGMKTPLQRVKLQEKQEDNRMLLRFVRDATMAQRKRGGAILDENPNHHLHGKNLSSKKPLVAPGTQHVICACMDFASLKVHTSGKEPD